MEAIAGLVPDGCILADIGTDHAQLPIALVQRGICRKAYAADVAEGPLNSARNNLIQAGTGDLVVPVLSDGFDRIPADADCAVIAGMGYRTAQGILETAMDRLPSFRCIIVQINNEADTMRAWISAHHGRILDERYVRDRGKDYEITSFCMDDHAPYSEEEILLGPCLKEQADPGYIDYCVREYKKAKHINALRREKGKPADEELIRKERILESYLQDHLHAGA